MIFQELDQRLRREIQYPLRRCRPDRTGQRQNVIVAKPRACAQVGQQIAHGQTGHLNGLFGLGVKMQDIAQHAQKTRIGNPSALREQSIKIAKSVFQTPPRNRGAE